MLILWRQRIEPTRRINEELDNMKALVSGGNGFIGSHLLDQLVKSDWEVAVLDPNEDVTITYHPRCVLSAGI
jgi:FlaA1/EpsC-like NDP-sugar epimerase